MSAEFLTEGLDRDDLPVVSLLTLADPPGPEIELAIRLLEDLEERYGVDVDLADLEDAAAQTRTHFEEPGDRMRARQDCDDSGRWRDYPTERMDR